MSYILPNRWYRQKDGKQLGPYTIPELFRFVETSEARPEERVEAESGTEWLTIAEVLRRSNGSGSEDASSNQSLASQMTLDPKENPSSGRNYVLRHWRGDLSLGLSYWVNLFFLTLVLRLLFAMIGEEDLSSKTSYYQFAVIITSLVLATMLIAVWQIVGTWRSSDRHTSRGGRKFWAITAKVLLILGALRGGLEYASSEIPTVINAWRYATTMSALSPPEFRTLRGATEIELSGGIHAGTAAGLEALLNQSPRARVLHLASDGGNLAEGHAIAAMVRTRGLDTYVRSRCLSACSIVFLAGRNRLLRDGAQLGFHAPTIVTAGIQGAQIVSEEQRRLASTGVPDWFVSKAFAVSGDAMWFPTIEELFNARVITSTTNGRHLSPGRPNPLMTLEQAERSLRGMALGAALERVEPVAFRELAIATRETMNDGGTEGEIVSALERRMSPIYIRSLPLLQDRQMVTTIKTIIETARQLSASNPRLCRDWLMHKPGQPVPNIAQYISGQQQAALVQTMADVITAAADPRQRTAPPRQAPPQLDQVIRRLEARLPRGQLSILHTIESPSHSPNIICSLIVELYTEVLRLSERDAGSLLRFMLSNA